MEINCIGSKKKFIKLGVDKSIKFPSKWLPELTI